ncbi:hypothetical protein LCGC14_1489050 [marine sediment metagenome]|uniref:Uncharacterized protein n=1 Tax=marine sediment metagenome TaxID=412755 RepID=A0A0F9J7X5_9ZZZZ
MKEIVQLNLTEEESIILQALTVVGVSVHFKNAAMLEKEAHCLELFLDKWPEASASLADKMTGLVKISREIIEAR